MKGHTKSKRNLKEKIDVRQWYGACLENATRIAAGVDNRQRQHKHLSRKIQHCFPRGKARLKMIALA